MVYHKSLQKIFKEWEITNLVTRADHTHFVAPGALSGVVSSRDQNFRRSRDHGHAPFRKILRDHVWTVHENVSVKFEVRSFNRFGAITNAQKFKGSRNPGHAPFRKIIKGSYPNCPCKHARQIWIP